MSAPDPLLTAQEVSDFLQIPVPTLMDWRYKRTGPPFKKLGNHVRYSRADLERWIEAQTEGDEPVAKLRGGSPGARRGGGPGATSMRGTGRGSTPRPARSTLPGGDAA